MIHDHHSHAYQLLNLFFYLESYIAFIHVHQPLMHVFCQRYLLPLQSGSILLTKCQTVSIPEENELSVHIFMLGPIYFSFAHKYS